jgi:hypothetical protein
MSKKGVLSPEWGLQRGLAGGFAGSDLRAASRGLILSFVIPAKNRAASRGLILSFVIPAKNL